MLSLAVVVGACNTANNKKTDENANPFFSEYGTPFEVPTFDKIKIEHYMPALKKGLNEHKTEIDAIVNSTEEASFANTIEAMEYSGALLSKVLSVFYNQMGVQSNKEIRALAKEASPLMSAHSDDISLNAKLFERVKAVYEQHKGGSELNAEQARLLTETYKGFVRSGANLDEDAKTKLRTINKDMSMTSLQFGQNQLAEDNGWKLEITDEAQLAGLPEGVRAAMADAAGEEGKWAVSLHKPSWIPFLQYAENRTLREQVYNAWMNRGNNNNENDNKKNLANLASLRVKKANVLGYNSWAAYILEENMAKNAEGVYNLLDNLWERALPVAKAEVVAMQEMIDAEGGGFKLASHDWWYYAEKVRKAKYDLDDETLRPYFELNNVREGLFYVVEKLYGIKMITRTDIPTPHEDAFAYEVQEANGDHIGVLFMDFHPRESKRGGAWMSSYRKQSVKKGTDVTPVITTVFNFSKATGDKPALLSFNEVSTMFHEMGHALHGLLSQCTYNSLSGTSVARDFVELPSQIMEHWAAEPEVLKHFAKHYETGEVIPDELIAKMTASGKFNQGFVTVEYLAASILDMNWHTITDTELRDADTFENKAMKKIGLINEIIPRYKSTYFGHIFSGGYSSGYYAYIWAEVLDSDAFMAFKETGDLFNQEKATAFRNNVLARGGTAEAMDLYINFRGAAPTIDALLEKRGLADPK